MPAAYKDLMEAGNNLIDGIRLQRIYINSFEPCFDFAGNESDASVFPKEGHGLCVSSYRLGKKLSKENARIQLIALLAHEYAHFLGADENQAQAVQKDVFENLLSGSKIEAERFYLEYKHLIQSAAWELDKMIKAATSSTGKEKLCDRARVVGDSFLELMRKSSQNNYSIANSPIKMMIWTTWWHAESIVAGVCVLYPPSSGLDFLYQHYNKAFGTSTSLSLWEFKMNARLPFNADGADKNFMIMKIEDDLILNKDLERLKKHLNFIHDNTYKKISSIVY